MEEALWRAPGNVRALKNVFSAYNADDPSKSVVTTPAKERAAIEALIAYISQKPSLRADVPADEVDAYRYVRREAVRALGAVRKPVLREDKKIVAAPALWLLRVASMDPIIVPTPSLTERAEALIGFLQLAPDSQQNLDYASWFVGLGIVDLGYEFTEFKQVSMPPVVPANPPKIGEAVKPCETIPWRIVANRMRGALTEWKDAWDANGAGGQGPAAKLMAELVSKSVSQLFEPMSTVASQQNAEGVHTTIDTWLRAQQYPNVCLFKDDPTSVVTRPKRDQ